MITAPDADRRRDLSSMKRRATGLLALAAAVYLLTFAAPSQWAEAVGWVRAAAEAGMVGGLADWFAVTALFRHPLGLRIPHTALIPRNTAALAATLGGFVTRNFLTRETLIVHVPFEDMARSAASWLARPGNAAAMAGEVAGAARAVVERLETPRVVDVLLDAARRLTTSGAVSPALGRLLGTLVEGRAYQPLVDVLIEQARLVLVERREAVEPEVRRAIGTAGILATLWATQARVNRLLDGTVLLLEEMQRDPAHPTRAAIERLLRQAARDLAENAATAAAVDAAAMRVLEDPAARTWLTEQVERLRVYLVGVLQGRDASVVEPLTGLLADLAARVQDDEAFRSQIAGWLSGAASYLVEEYADEFTRLVERTVGGWGAERTVDLVETAVGRDLQFIRINGTVVGALAGVVIHAVEVVLG